MAMSVWAIVIMLATALSMATAMLGFIVTIPVIGHAGDTEQDGRVLAQWHDDWALPLTGAGGIGQSTPVLVARGNHDAESANAYAYHWLPGNGSWYAETFGPARD